MFLVTRLNLRRSFVNVWVVVNFALSYFYRLYLIHEQNRTQTGVVQNFVPKESPSNIPSTRVPHRHTKPLTTAPLILCRHFGSVPVMVEPKRIPVDSKQGPSQDSSNSLDRVLRGQDSLFSEDTGQVEPTGVLSVEGHVDPTVRSSQLPTQRKRDSLFGVPSLVLQEPCWSPFCDSLTWVPFDQFRLYL